ncbi:type 4a pilus biogenesis protein PilO [Gracilibacillus salinarum]|uniref:Type 4a pilus biogenesis protein PilO n=1 Tax=Gracilibacillus salinarum TaxID=2932255 RepID=A0ABY4GP48_9BACI|nr:type 4a pilus biogenesis protein PilO [Gracilibacillus salinarum]UOQ86158.1 type 4a pilus biogenesis protein PilO [Gracilibacillus salinarum]
MTVKWTRASIFWLLLVLLLIVGAYLLGRIYFLDPVKADHQKISMDLQTQELYLANADTWEETVGNMSPELLEKLPVHKQNDAIIQLLDQAKKASQLSISSVQVEENTSEIEDVQSLIYLIEGQAPAYDNFHQFLTKLNENSRVIDIRQINFDRTDDEHAIDFTIQFHTFFTPDLQGLEAN